MAKAILTLDEMPKTCGNCPIFESNCGCEAHCAFGAEYTLEEIYSGEDEDYRRQMYYYNGYLSNRPAACPLKESEDN